MKKKLFRVAAVPGSLAVLLKGQLRFMSEHYDVTGIASEGYQHKTIQDSEGIETIEIRIDRQIKVWADIVSLYRLYVLFRKEKPYIVHSLTPKAGLLSMMAAYFAGVPHRLHTFTGLIFPTQSGLLKKMLIFFDRVICFCATRVYPEGEGVKRDLIGYKITKKPLKVVGHGNVNGIDLSHFDPALYDDEKKSAIKKELGIESSDFVMSFVGRIVYDKGIEEMINAFVKVNERYKGMKLVLVGPYENQLDPLPVAVEQEITNNPNIISVGWQPDVRPFFAITDVFVFPSYREGFPNVVLQAGAMGKFSIVTDINGSNEIIHEGFNGTIIPVKDTQALTQAMSNCIENAAVYKEADPRYRALIAEKYDQFFVWNAQLDEYKLLDDALVPQGL